MLRVLIVHRDAVQRHFLAGFLEHEGFEVAQSATADDACRLLLGEASIQIMLVDLDVSGVSAGEYGQVFRHAHDARFAGIPFLCVSSRLSTCEGERLTAFLGGQAFVSLPVDPASLRQRLSQVIEGKNGLPSPQVLLVGKTGEWVAVQAKIFRLNGWSVRDCQRAFEVKSHLAEYLPDLLVIHHLILDSTNVEWMDEVKRQAPSARIFVVTADHESQLALESLQYGAQAFVREPIDQAYLDGLFVKAERERVDQCLSHGQESLSLESGWFETNMKRFLHDFDEIVIWTDDEGVIVDINAHGSRVLDWPAQDICGHTLTMLEPSGPLNWLSSAQGSVQPRETHFRTRSGATVEVLVSAYPVHCGEGVRFILVAKDIQELAVLRTEVRRLHEQVQQYKELEAVGRLAGGIAHDVNNILTAIQGHASLIMHKGDIGASIDQPMEVIRQAVHRGQELTAQLLGAARRGNERRSSRNVHDAIDEVLDLLSGNRTNGIHIVREFEAQDPWINFNARQLHQVLLNLLVNACDAMLHGGTLTISTMSHQQGAQAGHQDSPFPDNPFLEICVTDSGCGIPDEVRQAVFDPFFSTKPSDKGTGMGLAIIKEIIKAHGGRITLSSEVNRGTSFHLYFPQGRQAQSGLIHLPTVLGRSNPRILVVDDEPLVAETTAEMVRFFGCEPWVASNGQEAIEQYREHSDEIDVIVLDLSMPEMSGEDCFQTLRAINPSVMVVFSSGVVENFSFQQLVDDGVAGFVQKPFDVEDLSLALKQVCAKERHEARYALSGVSATEGSPKASNFLTSE